MKDNNLVNLFIVGAEKAATTFLVKYLSKHKDIFFPIIKEPQFFSKDILPEYQDEEGLLNLPEDKWYKNTHIAFIRDKELYLKLYKDSQNYKYRGDGSVSYLYSKVAAKEIYNYNSEAKIIISLRNPIERAFSAYKMDIAIGRVNKPFEEAIKEIPRYIERGLYFNQVKRYYDIFPPENIHIILFDDLKSDPLKVFNSIFQFLSLGPIYNIEVKKVNESMKPVNSTLNYLLYKTGVKNLIRKYVPSNVKEFFKKFYYCNNNMKIDEKIYNSLIEIFREDIETLSSLINKDLSKWLEKK